MLQSACHFSKYRVARVRCLQHATGQTGWQCLYDGTRAVWIFGTVWGGETPAAACGAYFRPSLSDAGHKVCGTSCKDLIARVGNEVELTSQLQSNGGDAGYAGLRVGPEEVIYPMGTSFMPQYGGGKLHCQIEGCRGCKADIVRGEEGKKDIGTVGAYQLPWVVEGMLGEGVGVEEELLEVKQLAAGGVGVEEELLEVLQLGAGGEEVDLAGTEQVERETWRQLLVTPEAGCPSLVTSLVVAVVSGQEEGLEEDCQVVGRTMVEKMQDWVEAMGRHSCLQEDLMLV